MDDIETARKHAADNYDASKDWSDEMLALLLVDAPDARPGTLLTVVKVHQDGRVDHIFQ